MYRLKRLNVVKEVDTREGATRLEEQGFRIISDPCREVDIKPLEELNLSELRAAAKQNGIEGASKLGKDELLALLQQENT